MGKDDEAEECDELRAIVVRVASEEHGVQGVVELPNDDLICAKQQPVPRQPILVPGVEKVHRHLPRGLLCGENQHRQRVLDGEATPLCDHW